MDNIIKTLEQAGLKPREAKLYYELLRLGPSTHLQLSRATEINRTKVYRLIESLHDRQLVTIKIDSSGKRIIPADPTNILLRLNEEQAKIQAQLDNAMKVMPALEELASDANPLNFQVKTYQGIAGFKQMLWNELSAENDLLCFEKGNLDELIPDEEWLERFRAQYVRTGIIAKSIQPIDTKYNPYFTQNQQYLQSFHQQKYVSPSELDLTHHMTIYNNCVATYCWRDGQKIGVEIVNQHYAQMMRDIFYSYWDRLPTVARDKYYKPKQ